VQEQCSSKADDSSNAHMEKRTGKKDQRKRPARKRPTWGKETNSRLHQGMSWGQKRRRKVTKETQNAKIRVNERPVGTNGVCESKNQTAKKLQTQKVGGGVVLPASQNKKTPRKENGKAKRTLAQSTSDLHTRNPSKPVK